MLDVGAEERDEHGPGRVEALAPSLEPVTHLVEEEQEDDAEPEAPAPDQRIAAERDEDEPELREGAELHEQPEEDDERCGEPAKHPAPVGAARLDGLVLAVEVRFHPSELYRGVRAAGGRRRSSRPSRGSRTRSRGTRAPRRPHRLELRCLSLGQPTRGRRRSPFSKAPTRAVWRTVISWTTATAKNAARARPAYPARATDEPAFRSSAWSRSAPSRPRRLPARRSRTNVAHHNVERQRNPSHRERARGGQRRVAPAPDVVGNPFRPEQVQDRDEPSADRPTGAVAEANDPQAGGDSSRRGGTRRRTRPRSRPRSELRSPTTRACDVRSSARRPEAPPFAIARPTARWYCASTTALSRAITATRHEPDGGEKTQPGDPSRPLRPRRLEARRDVRGLDADAQEPLPIHSSPPS